MIRQVVRHNDDATTSAQEDEKKAVAMEEEEYAQALVEPVEETLAEGQNQKTPGLIFFLVLVQATVTQYGQPHLLSVLLAHPKRPLLLTWKLNNMH